MHTRVRLFDTHTCCHMILPRQHLCVLPHDLASTSRLCVAIASCLGITPGCCHTILPRHHACALPYDLASTSRLCVDISSCLDITPGCCHMILLRHHACDTNSACLRLSWIAASPHSPTCRNTGHGLGRDIDDACLQRSHTTTLFRVPTCRNTGLGLRHAMKIVRTYVGLHCYVSLPVATRDSAYDVVIIWRAFMVPGSLHRYARLLVSTRDSDYDVMLKNSYLGHCIVTHAVPTCLNTVLRIRRDNDNECPRWSWITASLRVPTCPNTGALLAT